MEFFDTTFSEETKYLCTSLDLHIFCSQIAPEFEIRVFKNFAKLYLSVILARQCEAWIVEDSNDCRIHYQRFSRDSICFKIMPFELRFKMALRSVSRLTPLEQKMPFPRGFEIENE